MGENIGAWEEVLKNGGYTVYPHGAVKPPSEPVDLDDYPAVVGDFGGDANDGNIEGHGDEAGVEDEDDVEDYADADDVGYVRPPADRIDIRENTPLVTAAFYAAGGPQFQDVRLKPAKTVWAPAPTLREIARRRGTPSSLDY
jgi:hypothetical protein